MILSVSRRTDIPAFYSNWFLNGLKRGYFQVKNPMNIHQVSEIEVSHEKVDCIVFWTKNPKPMIDKLDTLESLGYKNYYFQFTLTGYGQGIEPNLPDKKILIETFKELSRKIGKERVIWRYDPIFLNKTYHKDYHIKAFKTIATKLSGYTDRVIISFIDMYAKTKRNMAGYSIDEMINEEILEISEVLVSIAKENNMKIETCAEKIELSEIGIEHSACIDKNLVENIIGYRLKGKKDNKREACGCFEVTEIGKYNTCHHGCKYCYANYSENMVKDSKLLYDENSPLLCDVVNAEKDKITKRAVKSNRDKSKLILGQLKIE